MPKFSVRLELNGKPHNVVLEADSMPDEASVMAALKGSAFDPERKPARAEDFAPKDYNGWHQQDSSSLGRGLAGAWEQINPFAGLSAIGTNIANEYHNLEGNQLANLVPGGRAVAAVGSALLKPVLHSMGSELSQVPDAMRKAWQNPNALNVSDAVSHTLAGIVPVVGMSGAAARQKAEEGDTAGAVGTALGAAVAAKGLPKMGALSEGAMRAAQGAARSTAEMHLGALMKVPKSIQRTKPGLNIPGVVLDEGMLQGKGKWNPVGSVTKSVEAADTTIDNIATEVSSHVAGKGYKAKPTQVFDQLDNVIGQHMASLTGQADAAAVQAFRNELMQHPLYTKPVMHMVDGQWVPTGRRVLKALDAELLDQMKKDVYKGLENKYGQGRNLFSDPVRVGAEKAVGRGLKQAVEQFDPAIADLNARQGRAITAKRALEDWQGRDRNVFKQGLMDFGALSAGTAGPLLGIPGTAPLAAGYGAYSMLLKHPSTAIPVIRGMNALSQSTALRSGARNAGRLAAVGTGANMALRPLKKDEFLLRKQQVLEDLGGLE